MASFALVPPECWKSCRNVTICIVFIATGLHLTVGLVWYWHYAQTATGFTAMALKALPLRWSVLADPITGQTSTVETGQTSTVETGQTSTLEKRDEILVKPEAMLEPNNNSLGDTKTIRSDKDWFSLNVSNMFHKKNESEQLDMFLTSYKAYCEKERRTTQPQKNGLPLCPCVSPNLVGRQDLKKILPSNPDLNHTVEAHPDVVVGGSWRPLDCQPRQKIAIIIPYRGRKQQLLIFLQYMVPFLKRQLVQFTICVVEQGEPEVFNKASLMNAGFLELSKNESFDCYFFHDVDTLPEDDRNFYTCTDNPRHLGFLVDRYRYKPYYLKFVGGGVAFTAEQFKRINGFSNKFYGWGGEDDDTYFRIIYSNMTVIRFPVAVARYTTLSHTRDSTNPVNLFRTNLVNKIRQDKKRTFATEDGLTTLKYTLRVMNTTALYTWMLVDLPPPPEYYRFKQPKPKPKAGQAKLEDHKR